MTKRIRLDVPRLTASEARAAAQHVISNSCLPADDSTMWVATAEEKDGLHYGVLLLVPAQPTNPEPIAPHAIRNRKDAVVAAMDRLSLPVPSGTPEDAEVWHAIDIGDMRTALDVLRSAAAEIDMMERAVANRIYERAIMHTE